jgi:hypothetical protein
MPLSSVGRSSACLAATARQHEFAAVDITGSDFLIAGGAAASFFYGPDAQKS